jgi:arginine repressor
MLELNVLYLVIYSFHLQNNASQPQIVKILKKDGINVPQKTVSNVKRKIRLQRNSVEKIKFSRIRPVVTPSIISKVIKKIDVDNPPTQRFIAKSYHVSQSTISRIIKRSNFVLRKKQKFHNY